jgi:hypothetical protein
VSYVGTPQVGFQYPNLRAGHTIRRRLERGNTMGNDSSGNSKIHAVQVAI